jgi:hypothetical protein
VSTHEGRHGTHPLHDVVCERSLQLAGGGVQGEGGLALQQRPHGRPGGGPGGAFRDVIAYFRSSLCIIVLYICHHARHTHLASVKRNGNNSNTYQKASLR